MSLSAPVQSMCATGGCARVTAEENRQKIMLQTQESQTKPLRLSEQSDPSQEISEAFSVTGSSDSVHQWLRGTKTNKSDDPSIIKSALLAWTGPKLFCKTAQKANIGQRPFPQHTFAKRRTNSEAQSLSAASGPMDFKEQEDGSVHGQRQLTSMKTQERPETSESTVRLGPAGRLLSVAGLDVVLMGVVDQCRGILLFPACDSQPAEELDDSRGMLEKEKLGTVLHITSHITNITIQRQTPGTHRGVYAFPDSNTVSAQIRPTSGT
ncbi:unnamed protein product [Leuciscus chuanchicus]